MLARQIREVRYTSKFKKAFQKMPSFVRGACIAREAMFRKDVFHPLLDTHKLKGKYRTFWSFTVIGQYRVMFAFLSDEIVAFVNIGTHSIYKRK